jgi:hypothetical protein
LSQKTKNAIFGENFSYLVFTRKKIQIQKNYFFFKNIFDMPIMSKSKKNMYMYQNECQNKGIKIPILYFSPDF